MSKKIHNKNTYASTNPLTNPHTHELARAHTHTHTLFTGHDRDGDGDRGVFDNLGDVFVLHTDDVLSINLEHGVFRQHSVAGS